MGDIVLGTFQSCDVEVVGREGMGLGEPLNLGEEELIGESERVDGRHLWTLESFAKRVRNMGRAKRTCFNSDG